MAISFTPDDVASGFNLTKLNSNFDKVEVALGDALSRSGNGPNQMNADIDLNSNDLLNINQVHAENLFLNGELVQPVTISNALKTSNALSELPAAGLDDEARTNLGLGNSATRNVGTTAGTVAAGDDSRIVNALQPLTRIQTRSDIIRGDGISDTLWNTKIGDFDQGERGPLFVWNDPAQASLAAGMNSGMQIWVGDNPTATPGVGHAVGSTIAVINGNDRNAMYGQNILVGASTGLPGYVDSFIAGMEINIYSDFAATVSDAFTGGNRKNGLELTSQGSIGRVTSAAAVWSADATGNAWWYHGLSLSRCVDTGINFQKDPAGSIDGITSFGIAAIYDKSNSTSVLKVDGSHTNIFDLSTITSAGLFVKGRASANTSLLFRNNSAFDYDLTIDSGVAAGAIKNSSITFSDRNVAKWQFIKNTGNTLGIFDVANGIAAMSFDGNTTDAVTIRVGNADKRVQVGAVDSGGAGFRMLRVAN